LNLPVIISPFQKSKPLFVVSFILSHCSLNHFIAERTNAYNPPLILMKIQHAQGLRKNPIAVITPEKTVF